MSSTSGVLVVGNLQLIKSEFGADVVKDVREAETYLENKTPAVLLFATGHGRDFDDFCDLAMRLSPESLWIVSMDGLKPSQIIHGNNFGNLHDLVDDADDPTLEEKLKSALEARGNIAQNAKHIELFEDQSQRLKRLTNELEARVAKRHKGLRKSLKTLEQTKVHLEALHQALLGIHRASTILQMEQTLNEALKTSLKILWVKIRFANQSSLKSMAGAQILAIELPMTMDKMRGEVLFAKPEGKCFSPVEVDFLQELTEALSLALSRLNKLEQAETLKAQWQATFDSIPHALCVTNADFEILKLNSAFQQACPQHSFRSLIGKNCFHIFFGQSFKPPTKLDSPFTFRNARVGSTETEHFEVVGERLGLSLDDQPVQLILLRSVTEEARFERRIFDASKLAELGTIGSSIAHELNNPLGGMLSFLQLILMDLKPADDLYSDVKSMESAVLRCRDIVLNLLSFARKHDLSDIVAIDMFEVIDKSVKLIELQSKSKGIDIEFDRQGPALIRCSQNALSQALCNVLQNSIDAISEKIKSDPLFPGKIKIDLKLTGDKFRLTVHDNGTGIRPEIQSQIFNPLFTTRDPRTYAGMGLTTAFTIVSEHHGSLEILSQTGSGTTAIVSLPTA
jgi:signal transduction histidine kinase